jgi:hypothetical protein
MQWTVSSWDAWAIVLFRLAVSGEGRPALMSTAAVVVRGEEASCNAPAAQTTKRQNQVVFSFFFKQSQRIHRERASCWNPASYQPEQ